MKTKGIISATIAISVGVLVLFGAFFPYQEVAILRSLLLQWGVILAAVALIVGVGNLLRVHLARISTRQKGLVYSLILVISLLTTLFLGFSLGPDDPTMLALFNTVQLPVEASLAAVLAITFLYASARLLRWRNDLIAVVFILTAFVVLLGTAPLPFGEIPLFNSVVRPFVVQVLATGGARGILLGVALGTLTTGLRILFGADRPYGSK